MSVETGIGDILKTARLATGKTLGEMASRTQINIRYLSELETGEEFSLPEIYRRTFIRTYAKALGLDEEELPAPEGEEGGDDTGVEDATAAGLSSGPPVEKATSSPVFPTPFSDTSQFRTMVIVVIFLVTALILAVKWLGSGSRNGAEHDRLAQERGAGARPGENLSAFNQGRRARGAETTGGAVATDSLVLVATSTESVWVHIVLDNDSTVEYTMPPKYSVTLRAAENFLLAVGNPAGLSISLNGRHLDILGDGNRPRKNILLSRKTLSQ